jgi:hypothetical protein
LLGHGGSVLYGNIVTVNDVTAYNKDCRAVQFLVSGLAPGTSYTFDLASGAAGGNAAFMYCLGQSTTTPSGTDGAPVIMTVQQV